MLIEDVIDAHDRSNTYDLDRVAAGENAFYAAWNRDGRIHEFRLRAVPPIAFTYRSRVDDRVLVQRALAVDGGYVWETLAPAAMLGKAPSWWPGLSGIASQAAHWYRLNKAAWHEPTLEGVPPEPPGPVRTY